MSTPPVPVEPEPKHENGSRSIRNLRWYICALLFFATTVNYMDRQVLGILKPVLEHDLHWSESDFGWLVFAFSSAYALMMPVAGRVLDSLGARIGYAIAVVVWSIASMSHFFAQTVAQFALARFGLGAGEAANFPAAIKVVADWFPQRERALATGIFNSGSNVGAIAAPLLVPLITLHFGWRYSFLCTGCLDCIWLLAWLLFFRRPEQHPRLSRHERALIVAGRSRTENDSRIPYKRLLRNRAALAIFLAKLLTDPVWWFYLFWLPGFLFRRYGLDLSHLGLPLVIIYLAADVGSVGAGWLSSHLLARGWNITSARKTALLICACSVVPIAGIMIVGHHLWLAVGLIGLAAAAHQGWSANVYTLASDTFPRSAVASVVGLAGVGGAIGGMLVSPLIGYWLDFSHQAYAPLFVLASMMYLIAFFVIRRLVPTFENTTL